jgi:16S rRNA (adenine1518-N6/adenine1519-N6)-dimethyltransferase
VVRHAPKKSLGQHWLHDEQSLAAMVVAADVQPDDTVLEIGPGLGTLTATLLAAGANVIAVEYDHDLAAALPRTISHPNLTVLEHDILTFDFSQLPPNYKVTANIPYYLTSNLLRVMCETPNHFSTAALLIQKEVAERVVAAPGAMSLLSVCTQFYCEVGLGPVVPAELFTPPPKVDSQILMLEFREKPLFPDVDTAVFFRLVRAGFSERRKMLRSSLSGGLGITKPEAEELLESAGIDSNLRAQALTMQQWYALYRAYQT